MINLDFKTLNINEDNYFHVRAIEIMNGNDDGDLTDRIKCIGLDGKILCMNNFVSGQKAGRLRNELAVAIHLDEESGGGTFRLYIQHHKGQILLSATNQKGEDVNVQFK